MSKARQSDSFKPKLPLDPFSGMDIHQPWLVHHDKLTAALSSLSKQVVLILGSPNEQILHSLTTAKSLSSSLIVIATHNPPALPEPSLYGPTVRVLVLSEPLFTRDAGALRLVNLLQRAERVARAWRASGLNYKKSLKYRIFEEQPRILYLAEAEVGGEFTNVYAFPEGTLHSRQQTLSTPPPSRPPSTMSSTSSRNASKRMSKFLTAMPPTDPSQRSFDAILDFLEHNGDMGEKALLKQAILVTTLSQPFLSAIPSIPGLSTISKRRSVLHMPTSFANPEGGLKSSDSSIRTVSSAASSRSAPARWNSIFIGHKSGLSSSTSDSGHFFDSVASTPGRLAIPLAPVERSHLIHILPASMQDGLAKSPRSKLTQSIEQFLVNFAYPESSLNPSSRRHSFASAVDIAEGQCEKAVPFLIPTHALCAVPILLSGLDAVAHSNTGAPMSITELILNGLLDPQTPPHDLAQKGKRISLFNSLENPARAWIGSVADVKPASEVAQAELARNIPLAPEFRSATSLPVPTLGSGLGPTQHLAPPSTGRIQRQRSLVNVASTNMVDIVDDSTLSTPRASKWTATLNVQTANDNRRSALPTPPDSSSSDEETPADPDTQTWQAPDTDSITSTLEEPLPGHRWFRSEATLPAMVGSPIQTRERPRVDSVPTTPSSRSLFGRSRRKGTVDAATSPQVREKTKNRWKFWTRI